ncbi:LamG-like jellyroll fold domain-containing protein [Flavobacterium xinjiangense]|uniref:Por secretion system C-terminal sorting domain-containing protein n=1 Tax=Flavobacterium xinjiangense TaxID=178356 RepID=A0A1M7KAS2_9FLAO|nr:LamG-like jellyroll fold domain-containing protein [Flavobacterium xinjiangense]SHM62370.1 Por secretion system C-terminal sorting domain-containing protein [Flavobacterium xinjiangense]
MKKNTTNKLLLSFVLLWSVMLFSQADPTIHVSYGNPPIEIANGGTVNFGASTEIAFAITNIPSQGNPSLTLANPEVTLSNSNFVISSPVTQFNIKKGETSVFKIRKNNFACNSSPQSTIVTINSNGKNYPTFSFIITYTNSPSISVLGGTPTQPVPNGQTVPTSSTGTLYGTVDVLASTTRTYAITNTGTCPLTLGSLTCLTYNPQTSLQSPDFTIIALTASTINPGGVAYLVVRFTPQSTGIKWAIISIPNNDATKNPYSFVVKGEAYNPTVTGPGGINADFRLWLKATRGINLASGTKIALWKDLGSLGKDASQTTVANQPTFVDAASSNINFNPVVQFKNDGTSSFNQFMYNIENGYYTHETFIVMEPDGAVGAPMTIISGTSASNPSYPVVANEHSGIGLGNFTSRLSNEKLWFNQWQTTNSPYFTVADALGDYTKAGIINTRNKTTTASAGMDLLFNSNTIGNQTSISASLTYGNLGYDDAGLWKGTPYNIGKNLNEPTYGNLNGRVAEVISYASRVPDADRPKIETYLAIKYGITLGVNGTSKNYIDSGGNIIWNSTNNVGFNYNIAGIGRNVDSDLYQKQSKSIYDSNEVTIGLGVIAATNSANINQFKKDRDFLVWGSDNGTYTASGSNTTTISSGITTSTIRINKKWKIVETKTDVDGDVENVFVGIPVAAFSAFPKLANEEYALIVSDNPNFNDADIIDIIPLKSDGIGNLQTWYDFDGTKYFTFGKALKVETKQLVKSTASIIDKDFLVGEYALNLNSGSFTVGCWIRNDGSNATNKTIFGKGTNLEIRLNAQNKIEALWDGASRFVSNTAVADGKWHNIVAVYYVGSADFYIDGVIESSTFNLQNPSPNYTRFSVGSLYIDKNNIINPFIGEIDEIHIWDMALSSDQINYLMNQEFVKYADNTVNGKIIPQYITKNSVKTIPWTKLKAYYDFNSFYGTTVEGLTDDRNFLRIKYLNKNKQILNTQTAPLPYETVADGLWSSSAIWKNGSLQTIPNDNSIVNQTPQPVVKGNIVKLLNNVESTGNKTLLGLFVEGTDSVTYKTLLASNNTKIEVSNYLKLDGLIDLKDRSQLVQTLNSELDPTSKGFIKRSQQGTINKYNYNYWSSPVGPINSSSNNNNYTVNGVFKDGSTTTPQNINWVTGYNGSQTTPISLARYWLYKFQNGTEYADWIHFDEITDPILPAQGFIFKGAGAVDSSNSLTQNYTFVGKPFNGLINGNSVLADNLFLVGNPYPSALDAYTFISDNINTIDGEITGELYFWQHSPDNNTHILGGYTGGYATLTLTGGTGPVAPIGINGVGTSTKLSYQYIPVGQGFFVLGKLGIVGAVPIIFNNNQRAFVKENDIDDLAVPISNTLFKIVPKKNYPMAPVNHFNENSNDVVYNNYNTKIRLGFNTAKNYHRQLLIGFMNDLATDGLDKGYDGYQIDTQANDLYFLIDDWEYTIQGVGAFDVSKVYPLGIKTDTIGNVQFTVDSSEFLPANQKIYIHDKETSVYYDITEKAADVNLPAGTFNTRFELAFQTDKSLSVKQNELPESMLIVYNNEIKKKLCISKNQAIDIKEVSIYNIVGQQLSTVKKVPDGDTVEIPFNLQKGVYVVKISTDKGVISKKIVK